MLHESDAGAEGAGTGTAVKWLRSRYAMYVVGHVLHVVSFFSLESAYEPGQIGRRLRCVMASERSLNTHCHPFVSPGQLRGGGWDGSVGCRSADRCFGAIRKARHVDIDARHRKEHGAHDHSTWVAEHCAGDIDLAARGAGQQWGRSARRQRGRRGASRKMGHSRRACPCREVSRGGRRVEKSEKLFG